MGFGTYMIARTKYTLGMLRRKGLSFRKESKPLQDHNLEQLSPSENRKIRNQNKEKVERSRTTRMLIFGVTAVALFFILYYGYQIILEIITK